jgi:uncharacterized surface protein with fasciclin (FAS1) repeats
MARTAVRVVSVAAVAALAALVFAACGGSSSTTTSPTPSPTPSPSVTPSVIPSPAQGSALNAAKSGDLEQFLKIVTAAGLEKQLAEKGPWTIFAPNEAAFASIPLSQLRADVNRLKAVVQYHVVPDANIQIADVQNGASYMTAQGSPVIIYVNGAARLVNSATIVGGYAGSDWTIYIIDQVLSPPEASPSPSPF